MAAQSNQKNITINISSLTLMKVLFIIALVGLLFYIKSVLLIIFVALILASALDPWVDWLQKHKIPRSFSILLIYLVLLSVIGGIIYLIIPPIVKEVNQLTADFPVYWQNIIKTFADFQNYSDSHGWSANIQSSLKVLQTNIGGVAGDVFSTIFSFFGGVISFLIILVITFYLTVEEKSLKRLIRSLVPVKYQPYFTHLVNRIQEKIGQWLRGQLILSLIIFVVVFLGLTILGVKYALVLALFAGITELIPYLGPTIGAIPAVFIAFTQSPMLALFVILLYILVQFLENHIIVPKVMQKAVGLNPVVVIVAMLIGAKLAGILGVILAVPVTTALGVILSDFIEIKQEEGDIEV
ncbi:MAG: AI-2E family transporter [Patescibacteria group bacterium]